MPDPQISSASSPTEVLTARRDAILDQITANGFVTLEVLAAHFGVSMQTVRRDVMALHKRGLIRRFHGGAGLPEGGPVNRLTLQEKRGFEVLQKQRIAEKAVRLVQPGAMVFLDVGTTVEATAKLIAALPACHIVTNSLQVALLFDHRAHNVQILPGRIASEDGAIVGESTVAALSELRPDLAFIGCSAIESGGAVMDFDASKVAVKRMAIAMSRSACLLAATSKFQRSAKIQITHSSKFSEILTEAEEVP